MEDFFWRFSFIELKAAGILRGSTNELNSDSLMHLLNFMWEKDIEEIYQLKNHNKLWYLKKTGEFFNNHYGKVKGNILYLFEKGSIDRLGRVFHGKNVEINRYYNNPHENLLIKYNNDFIDKEYLYSKSKIKDISQSDIKYFIEQEENNFDPLKDYDIFISHSFVDSKDIILLKDILEGLGYSTYVDWIQDNKLDRSKVSGNTADVLRLRMRSCKSLLYVISQNSRASLWMPWELGYFDALKGTAAVIPLGEKKNNKKFKGQEYIELYPYATIIENQLVIEENHHKQGFENWIDTKKIAVSI